MIPPRIPPLRIRMARRLAWSSVRGGLLAIVVIVGMSMAILKFARVGALRGDTFRLYALVGEARGILKGSEVWLSGQKIGKVADIRFRSPTIADTSARLLLELEVMEKYRDAMHRDAEAQIKAGGSVMGPSSSTSARARRRRRRFPAMATPCQSATPMDVEGSTAQFNAATRDSGDRDEHQVDALGASRHRGTLGAVLHRG